MGHSQIVGGNSILSIEEAPYMVSISQGHTGFKGAGVILDKRTILTAGHVVNPYRLVLSSLVVHAGSRSRGASNIPQNRVGIKEVIFHDNFSDFPPRGPFPDYDIAIIKLDSDLIFSDEVQPINMARGCIFEGTTGTGFEIGDAARIYGWGAIDPNNPAVLAGSLRVADQEVYDIENSPFWDTAMHDSNGQTFVVYREWWKDKSMMCVHSEESQAHRGDSGGPVIITGANGEDFLAGIISWGAQPEHPLNDINQRYPTIATDVMECQDFIAENMEPGTIVCGVEQEPLLDSYFITSNSNSCPEIAVDLDELYSGSSCAELIWSTDPDPSNGVSPITGPIVSESGTYYAYYYDTLADCYSRPSAPVTADIINFCCDLDRQFIVDDRHTTLDGNSYGGDVIIESGGSFIVDEGHTIFMGEGASIRVEEGGLLLMEERASILPCDDSWEMIEIYGEFTTNGNNNQIVGLENGIHAKPGSDLLLFQTSISGVGAGYPSTGLRLEGDLTITGFNTVEISDYFYGMIASDITDFDVLEKLEINDVGLGVFMRNANLAFDRAVISLNSSDNLALSAHMSPGVIMAGCIFNGYVRLNESPACMLFNNDITTTYGGFALTSQFSGGGLFSGTTIEALGNGGIFEWEGDSDCFGNTITLAPALNPWLRQRGIHVLNGGGNTISQNTITLNSPGGGRFLNEAIVENGSDALIIEKNTLTGGSAGISTGGGMGHTIAENLITSANGILAQNSGGGFMECNDITANFFGILIGANSEIQDLWVNSLTGGTDLQINSMIGIQEHRANCFNGGNATANLSLGALNNSRFFVDSDFAACYLPSNPNPSNGWFVNQSGEDQGADKGCDPGADVVPDPDPDADCECIFGTEECCDPPCDCLTGTEECCDPPCECLTGREECCDAPCECLRGDEECCENPCECLTGSEECCTSPCECITGTETCCDTASGEGGYGRGLPADMDPCLLLSTAISRHGENSSQAINTLSTLERMTGLSGHELLQNCDISGSSELDSECELIKRLERDLSTHGGYGIPDYTNGHAIRHIQEQIITEDDENSLLLLGEQMTAAVAELKSSYQYNRSERIKTLRDIIAEPCYQSSDNPVIKKKGEIYQDYTAFLLSQYFNTDYDHNNMLSHARLCADIYGRAVHLARGVASMVESVNYKAYDGCLSTEKGLENRQHTSRSGHLFPNPSKGDIALTFEEPMTAEVIVTDLAGRVVLTNSVQDEMIIEIGLSGNPGIHFIELRKPNGLIETYKAIIME